MISKMFVKLLPVILNYLILNVILLQVFRALLMTIIVLWLSMWKMLIFYLINFSSCTKFVFFTHFAIKRTAIYSGSFLFSFSVSDLARIRLRSCLPLRGHGVVQF